MKLISFSENELVSGNTGFYAYDPRKTHELQFSTP